MSNGEISPGSTTRSTTLSHGYDTEGLRGYFADIGRVPLMNPEKEREIARSALKGDSQARRRLIEANLRFVVRIAKQYQNRGLPLEDLISEGNAGLLRAVDLFDPEKGFRFLSYAVWWIRQAILKALYEQVPMIRLPFNRGEELNRLKRLREKFLSQRGQDPPLKELASAAEMDERVVADLLEFSRQPVSLEAELRLEGDSVTLKEFLKEKRLPEPEDQALQGSLKEKIDQVLGKLPPRDHSIISGRFGLGGDKPQTLNALGLKHNLTKERIRQIEKKVLLSLREPLEPYRAA